MRFFNLPMERVEEAFECADGMTRFAIKNKLRAEHGQDGDPAHPKNVENRRRGTCAEFCLRWAFGMARMRPPFDYRKIWDARRNGDVGEDCEVRSTKYETGRMLLHEARTTHREHGDDELPWLLRNYALVPNWDTGLFCLPGWLPMPMAKARWHDFNPKGNRPCKAVEQDRLFPIRHLVIEKNGRKYRMRLDLLGRKE